jgi:hypothetical protein
MFQLLEDQREIAQAQQKLEATISRCLSSTATKNIGWPGGHQSGARLHTDQKHWFWSNDHKGADNPRRLNFFGRLGPGPGVEIAVEINTAYAGRSKRMAGLFARKVSTGRIYLLHTGRVGGGTEGVGKDNFLAYSGHKAVSIFDGAGEVRDAVIVMPIEGKGAVQSAINYVESVIDFKRAVRHGETNTPEARRRLRVLREYFDERGRRKTGQASARRIDYESRHGEIVKAVHEWRKGKGLPPNHRLVKDAYIDLGVAKASDLVELYEVKTSTSRPDIYTAIGQLTVHCRASDCRRVIVLPKDDQAIAKDLGDALKRSAIEVLRFTLTATTVEIAG